MNTISCSLFLPCESKTLVNLSRWHISDESNIILADCFCLPPWQAKKTVNYIFWAVTVLEPTVIITVVMGKNYLKHLENHSIRCWESPELNFLHLSSGNWVAAKRLWIAFENFIFSSSGFNQINLKSRLLIRVKIHQFRNCGIAIAVASQTLSNINACSWISFFVYVFRRWWMESQLEVVLNYWHRRFAALMNAAYCCNSINNCFTNRRGPQCRKRLIRLPCSGLRSIYHSGEISQESEKCSQLRNIHARDFGLLTSDDPEAQRAVDS